MTSPQKLDTARPGQAGFTLIELIVALGVTTIVMLGILFLFDFNNKLTRVQSNVTDMQQSLRIAQYDLVRMVRMAGRGGLNADQGIFIAPNVGDDAYILPADTTTKVLPGTDILTVRGVFSTPILQVAIATPGSLVLDPLPPAAPTHGYVDICKLSPAGQVQDLSSFTPPPTKPEALILVSPLDDRFYAVVELVPGAAEPAASCPAQEGSRVKFKIDTPYSTLGAAPADAKKALTKVAYVGVLEEYRFYVREDHSITDDADSSLTPVLSRARFYPNTQNPYGGDASNLKQDIADGIMDLQVALAFDRNGDGNIFENLVEPENENDEWLGNSDDDTAFGGDLKALRISTLARTNRPDNQYEAPVIDNVEDHAYAVASTDLINSETARKYRRRLLQTIVNVRNLTL